MATTETSVTDKTAAEAGYAERERERCVASVQEALARSDIVGASRILEAHDAARSTDADVLLALGRLMRLRGRYDDARIALERAIHFNPKHVAALVARARLARDLDDLAGADLWFGRAWANQSSFAQWVPEWLDLLVNRLNHTEEALPIAQQHCEGANDNADAWFWLGYVLQRNRLLEPALDAYQRCVQLAPQLANLRNNMAAAYLDSLEYEAAQEQLNEALKADPENGLAWTNLAYLRLKQDDPFAAGIAAERALAILPKYATAWQNYSNALKELQDWDGALSAGKRAHELEPGDPSFRWTLAMLQLVQGNYRDGWINNEARWQGSPELRAVTINWRTPRWNKEPLGGKTILIWSEQGHGDVLQLVRFVPVFARWVRQQGGEVAFTTFPSLLPLIERRLTGQVKHIASSAGHPLPAHDYQLPLGSLPLVLGMPLSDLPRYAAPYLSADQGQVQSWRERCATSGLKVGLAWTGSRTHQRNPYRSVAPYALANALSGIANVTFFSLQLDAPSEETDAIREGGLELTDHTADFKSFDDTAAYISQLDLVITVCTSTAHLAGALGVPTWVLLDVNPHWVWLLGRADSPWYPSVTLYRQAAYKEWGPVLDQVARDLAAHASVDAANRWRPELEVLK